jgi:very-short-patch-repair endonuclease
MAQLHSTAELRAAGMTGRDVRAALAAGTLRRLRVGRYASGPVDAQLEAAVAFGASLTCASALSRQGVWVLEPSDHWRLDRNGHHARSASSSHRRVHWCQGGARQGIDDVATALLCAQRCMSREALLCSIESALNSKSTTRLALSGLRGTTNGQWELRRSDARSESGLETLARVRLHGRGIRVRPQVRFAGIGRVDLLIGERLVLELDGEQWHSSPEARERDRRRDAALVALGCLPLRAGFVRVVHEWPVLESQILEIVRRDEHLWRGRRRREVRRFG